MKTRIQTGSEPVARTLLTDLSTDFVEMAKTGTSHEVIGLLP